MSKLINRRTHAFLANNDRDDSLKYAQCLIQKNTFCYNASRLTGSFKCQKTVCPPLYCSSIALNFITNKVHIIKTLGLQCSLGNLYFLSPFVPRAHVVFF